MAQQEGGIHEGCVGSFIEEHFQHEREVSERAEQRKTVGRRDHGEVHLGEVPLSDR
jgi:hypothetical protein